MKQKESSYFHSRKEKSCGMCSLNAVWDQFASGIEFKSASFGDKLWPVPTSILQPDIKADRKPPILLFVGGVTACVEENSSCFGLPFFFLHMVFFLSKIFELLFVWTLRTISCHINLSKLRRKWLILVISWQRRMCANISSSSCYGRTQTTTFSLTTLPHRNYSPGKWKISGSDFLPT